MGTRQHRINSKQILGAIQLPRGTRKVNAWGENHLWVRYRKGFNLSGLVEPRISVASARRVSNSLIIERAIAPTVRKYNQAIATLKT
ncbi:hypothetical protein LC608_10340 [Nostoc sp. XA010]|uniref:hypothetical protein n=1 Tax=Nostoc sp. XA010 TaxID=2780407 RepID=UPI001E2C5780|nr:hypothetical protein [Nostoc sp. XA010]MCC5657376.1 hypothetical protein [Nostoc sp. XA010]